MPKASQCAGLFLRIHFLEIINMEYIPNRFVEKQHNEICSHDHLREKASTFRFRKPISSKSTITKEKQRRKIENEVEEKRRIENNMVTLSVFVKANLEKKAVGLT